MAADKLPDFDELSVELVRLKQREPELVLEDVLRGLVSVESAARDYGVVVRDGQVAGLRREPRARPFFDRGPGFEVLRGRTPP